MNQTSWTCGSAITLTEILDAREKRAEIQQEMLTRHPASLLSFTLNIAGPVKVFPYSKWLYTLGCTLIYKGISLLEGKILDKKEVKENTGYEGFFALTLKPEVVKKYLLEQEETHPLGRLFDFDVLRPDGTKVSRQELGFPGRTCLLCENPAFLCGRSRTHSAQQLVACACRMTDEFYTSRMSVHIGLMMQKALFYEVNTSLKPGLVDRLHNGSHKDMCIDTFIKSAYALTPYFIKCARTGLDFAGEKNQLPALFQKLRILGREAEQNMKAATEGINTHKGIVFSGGILCGAAGYVKSRFTTDFSHPSLPEQLSEISRLMLENLLDDYKALDEHSAKTHGENLFLRHGITGIRGEAHQGFPHVLHHGLSLFHDALKKGLTISQAGLISLLYYIAHTEDTNLIIRSDYDTAVKIQTELAAFLSTASYRKQLEIIPELDRCFVQKNISPGGSADMLALTYFLYFLQTIECCFE